MWLQVGAMTDKGPLSMLIHLSMINIILSQPNNVHAVKYHYSMVDYNTQLHTNDDPYFALAGEPLVTFASFFEQIESYQRTHCISDDQ